MKTPGERLLAAMDRAKLNRTQLGKAVGVSQPAISKLIKGEFPGRELIESCAAVLQVDPLWIRYGENPPPWMAPPERVRDSSATYEATTSTSEADFLGTVAAQDEEWIATKTPRNPRRLRFRSDLALVQVMGGSAYPIVFPRQFAVVDVSAKPNDGNLVVAWTKDGKALLKRYREAELAPCGFVLVSVNIGRDCYLFKPGEVKRIHPVVGFAFANMIDWDSGDALDLIEDGEVQIE